MTDSFHAFFHVETVPANFVENTIKQCLDHGFVLTKSGGAEYVQKYETADHDHARDVEEASDEYTGADLSEVAAEIADVGEGEVTLWYDGVEFKLAFHVRPDQEWHIPKLDASFWRRHVTPDDHLSRGTAQDRIDHFVDAIAAIATRFDAELAYCDTLGMLEDVMPRQQPIANQIETVPWLTVLSEQLVAEFGGYDRVLETPAWRVEELDSGHVLIALMDNPVAPSESGTLSPDEYLLKGLSLSERE